MTGFKKKILFIIILAFVVRLYKINTPLADWHSFRQADTASVTREYIKHGIDLLHPRYHDLSNIQSGMQNDQQDNVEGWRMVEFPIVNGMLAVLLRSFPSLDLVVTSRLASVLASLVSLVCLMLIVRRVAGDRVSLMAGCMFAIMPYSIYYSRTILPEPYFIAFSLLSLRLFQIALIRKNKSIAVLSAVVFSLALLVKPMAIFFGPVFVALWWMESGRLGIQEIIMLCAYMLACIPLLLWRRWIAQFPLGIPSSEWLYNGGGPQYALSPVYRVRFRPAWFRWLFYERLTKLFLGYFGLVPFLLSFTKRGKGLLLLVSFALGGLGYLVVFAAGNVQHDYYQAPLVPFVSLALGIGFVWLWEKKNICIRAVAILLVFGMITFTWMQVKGYYSINNWDIVTAGKVADTILPSDAKVIAPYQGDTAFLFQTNRTGWPIGFDIDKKISEGAQYYISVNYDDEARELEKKYHTVEKNPKYIILDLTKRKLD